MTISEKVSFNLNKSKKILAGLTAFSIPLAPVLVPVFIVLLFLAWIIEGGYAEKWKNLRKNKLAFPLMAFFLVHIIGTFWSSNIDYAVSDIGIKISLLLFPLVIVSDKYSKGEMNFVIWNFISGCLLLVLVLWIFAAYRYYLFGEGRTFYYTELAVNMHPTYLTLFFNFCILLLIDKLFRIKNQIFLKNFLFLSLLLLVFSIIALSSRMGILSLGITIGLGIFFLANNLKSAIIIFVLFILSSLFIYKGSDQLKTRFNEVVESLKSEEIEKATVSSSSVRILVWKASIDLFLKHPIIGVGTGDVKDDLFKFYEEEGLISARAVNLNPHNQYLQTAVALGSIGLIMLFCCLLLPVIYAIRKKNRVLLLFALLMMFSLLTESIIERQSGVSFFAFFASILIFYPRDEF